MEKHDNPFAAINTLWGHMKKKHAIARTLGQLEFEGMIE